jgi:hypothetical protein
VSISMGSCITSWPGLMTQRRAGLYQPGVMRWHLTTNDLSVWPLLVQHSLVDECKPSSCSVQCLPQQAH